MQISSEPDAPHEDRARIEDALNAYNVAVTGDTSYWPINLFVRDDSGTVRGGLLGHIWGGMAHIGYLWVEDALRGQGHGSQLLAMAEQEARARGCGLIYLDTFSFQAPEFYQKHGYEVFGAIEGYPPGHGHFFLRKYL